MSSSKTVYAFQANIESFIAYHGIERCGFLTLTFPDDVKDVSEASRRFNSFRTNFLSLLALGYIGVYERTKRGVIHFHFVVALPQEIRGNFDFAQVKARNYRSVNKYLRKVWKILRTKLPEYGFGRHQLVPVLSNAGICSYLAKYLIKGFECRMPEDKGFRFIRTSRANLWRKATCRFSWLGYGGEKWRKALAAWVSHVATIVEDGIFRRTGFVVRLNESNYSDLLRLFFGSDWCYKHRHTINYGFDSGFFLVN
ncbi:MAG: phasyl DNA replicon protein arp [Conchiformibius sp.]|nr:phasyl DNA replicon protein arp [Conchiformibius sp.]